MIKLSIFLDRVAQGILIVFLASAAFLIIIIGVKEVRNYKAIVTAVNINSQSIQKLNQFCNALNTKVIGLESKVVELEKRRR